MTSRSSNEIKDVCRRRANVHVHGPLLQQQTVTKKKNEAELHTQVREKKYL